MVHTTRIRARITATLLGGALFLPGCADASPAAASPTRVPARIPVVAAENQYGSMVQAIGGNRVQVTSLLTNPNTDPHEFEANASTAKTVANAKLIVKNGIGYDAWIDKLVAASPRKGRLILSAGELLGRRTGDNPHVWYSPAGWPREANAITADLIRLDSRHRAYYERRKAAWLRSLRPIYAEIATLRKRTHDSRAIATEPVYGYMIAALGATSLDPTFQKAVMDGTDPSPRSVAEFESDLRGRAVRMLFYNSQVVDPTTTNMRHIAAQSHVPVVGVTETQPPRLSFVRWQLAQLRNVQRLWR